MSWSHPIADDWRSVTTGQTAWTVSAGTVGDLRVIHTLIVAPGIVISNMAGGGVTTWNRAGGARSVTALNAAFGTNAVTDLWYGPITSTGTALTITYGGPAIGATSVRQFRRDFRSSRPMVNVMATQQSYAESPTAPNVLWSSLNTVAGDELVVCDSGVQGTLGAGSSTGYTYDLDPFGNPHAYRMSAEANQAQAPTYTTSGATQWYALETIFNDGYTVPEIVRQNAINRASRW